MTLAEIVAEREALQNKDRWSQEDYRENTRLMKLWVQARKELKNV